MTNSGSVDEFSAFFTVKPGQAENLRKAADDYVHSPGPRGRGGQAAIVKMGIRELRLTLFDNDRGCFSRPASTRHGIPTSTIRS